MSEPTRSPQLERLEPLAGEWSVEVVFPGAPQTDVRARAVFEWELNGQFLVQRTQVPIPEAPDSVALIAWDPERQSYTQHYFDSRGVVRVYAMKWDGSVWTLQRDTPDFSPLNFLQRFRAQLSDDGTRLAGAWEINRDGSTWEHDFDLNYTRSG